jgi:hypothetical protein
MARGPQSAVAERLVDLAETYCRLIDRRGRLSTEEFLNSVQQLLPDLYATAIALRKGKRSNAEYPESEDPDQPIWVDLRERFGPWDVHWDVFHPYQVDPTDPMAGSLADDLSGIYRDLQRGLAIWSLGTPKARRDAIWEWRFTFEIHWGRHVLVALRALHARRFYLI